MKPSLARLSSRPQRAAWCHAKFCIYFVLCLTQIGSSHFRFRLLGSTNNESSKYRLHTGVLFVVHVVAVACILFFPPLAGILFWYFGLLFAARSRLSSLPLNLFYQVFTSLLSFIFKFALAISLLFCQYSTPTATPTYA